MKKQFTHALTLLAFMLGAVLMMAAGAVPAQAGNTTLFSSQTGDVVLPISPPTNNGATAGRLDNTAIGITTPASGTFTGLTSATEQFSGTAPTPTGTGTPTIATGSTDSAGEVTAGTSATSVVITFASAKTNAPFCNVTSQTGGITSFAYAITTTAITVTQTATSGNKIDYHCTQH